MLERTCRIGLLVAALWVIPSMALAQKVAVLPVSYELVWTGKQAAGPAGRVQQSVERVARFVGFTPLGELGTEELCGGQNCLKRIGEASGADEVIQIAITDNDGVDFTVDLTFAHHEPLALQSSSSFDSVLAWIEDQVALVLQRRRDASSDGTAVPLEGETERDGGSSTRSVGGSLHPRGVWVALGSGAALLATGLILDLVVWRRSETLADQEPSERDPGYWETTDRLQVAEIVMFSAAGAALITGGVLALLTDFSTERRSSSKSREVAAHRVAPWFSPGGAGLSWSAKF